MARQAPTALSGQFLLESTTVLLAGLIVLAALELRADGGRTCPVPLRALPERTAAAADPDPHTLFRDALLLGD